MLGLNGTSSDARIYLDYAKWVGVYLPHLICNAYNYFGHSDILSFYKEELQGETSNVVHDRAIVSGKSMSQVLSDLVDEAVTAVLRAREILHEEKEKVVWEQLVRGYVAFHFLSPRYRLHELM